MFVDTHAHLHFKPDPTLARAEAGQAGQFMISYPDLEEVLLRAQQEGVTKIINIGVSPQDSRAAMKLARDKSLQQRARDGEVPRLYATAGLHPHDAAAIIRSRQLVEFGEFLDPLVGFLEFQPALIERLLQRAGEDADEHAAPDGQDEHQQSGKALEVTAMRHRDRLVGQKEQPGEADRHRRPDHHGLRGGRTQRTETEHDEQGAEEHPADFRRQVGERQRDQHGHGRLRGDQVMILEAFVEPEFRKQDAEDDQGQAGSGKGGGDHQRDRAGLRIEQQDPAVDQVTGADHDQNLPALPGASGERLRRRLGTDDIQIGWIYE